MEQTATGCAEGSSGPPPGVFTPGDASAIAMVRAGVRAAGPDEVHGVTRIGCRNESETSAVLGRLRSWSGCLVERARGAGFEAELTDRVEGLDVEASFRLRRVQEGVANLFGRFVAAAEERKSSP